MRPARQLTLDAVKNLPESCTMEDVLYQVHLVAQVVKGWEDAEAGRLISSDELLGQVEQWAK